MPFLLPDQHRQSTNVWHHFKPPQWVTIANDVYQATRIVCYGLSVMIEYCIWTGVFNYDQVNIVYQMSSVVFMNIYLGVTYTALCVCRRNCG